MYAEHFHLSAEPFSLTPDPAFLYLSPGHAEALAALKIGLEGGRGIMLMVGEVGMGKTTLLYSLLSELGDGVRTAYVSSTTLPFDALLRQALADFGVPCESRDRVELLAALNDFLGQCASDGTTAALVVDEAQNLRFDVFENLRLLSNYETFTEKLLQIVLVGQPELEMKLRRPDLRQVTERVAVRSNINPLTRAESLRYVEHRLQRVGGSSAAVFTTSALELILWKARGIPRRINILCHTAMLFAFGRGEPLVTFPVARTAVREREGRGLVTVSGRLRATLAGIDATTGRVRSRLRPWWALAGFAAGLLTMLTMRTLAPRTAPPDATAVTTEPQAVASETTDDASARGPEHDPIEKQLDAAIAALAHTSGARADAGPGAAQGAPAPTPRYRVVRVARGTTLRALIQDVYGDDHPELIDRVRNANPQIANTDRILAGDTLRFPELGGTREQ